MSNYNCEPTQANQNSINDLSGILININQVVNPNDGSMCNCALTGKNIEIELDTFVIELAQELKSSKKGNYLKQIGSLCFGWEANSSNCEDEQCPCLRFSKGVASSDYAKSCEIITNYFPILIKDVYKFATRYGPRWVIQEEAKLFFAHATDNDQKKRSISLNARYNWTLDCYIGRGTMSLSDQSTKHRYRVIEILRPESYDQFEEIKNYIYGIFSQGREVSRQSVIKNKKADDYLKGQESLKRPVFLLFNADEFKPDQELLDKIREHFPTLAFFILTGAIPEEDREYFDGITIKLPDIYSDKEEEFYYKHLGMIDTLSSEY